MLMARRSYDLRVYILEMLTEISTPGVNFGASGEIARKDWPER